MMDKNLKSRIENLKEVQPDELDLEMLKEDNDDGCLVDFEQVKNEIGYSGKISLRVPKSSHKDLATKAKRGIN